VLDSGELGQRLKSLRRGSEELEELVVVHPVPRRGDGDGEVLVGVDPFDRRAVDRDLELLTLLAANLHDRAGHVRLAREDERANLRRTVRLRGPVVEVLAPGAAELLLWNPLLELSVKPLADVEQLVLDAPPRRRLRRCAVMLVLEVPVIPDERLELLPPGECLHPGEAIVAATIGRRGRLAQLGERRLDKPEVTGSTPVPPT
jgi:hypothetical protein